MRLGACLVVAVVVQLGFAAPAFAAKPAERTSAAYVKDAEKLYQSGKYREAAEALLKAQQLEPNPRLVYNIARAYDQAGELKPALEYYQQYVGSSEGTDPTLLKRSALAIERLRGLVAKEEDAAAAQDAERKRHAEEVKAAEARATVESEAKRRAEADAQAQRAVQLQAETEGYGRAKAGAFVAGGFAVAGVGVGTVFGLLASNTKSRFTQAETVATKQELEADTRRNALIADIGFGVGVAAAVTAVLLYPKGEPPGRTASLLVGPGSVGVAVRF